ncbi:hypothetical protein SEA_GUYFAGIERI_90 [Rhodococcus phage GuyFagieri]|nr:hypothetical protein SEA_GUYFAGIERI_90 [Rhodococcus phage GuyFagieri]
MAQNARAALADIANANGWTVRRGETIGDGDTYTREGVTLTAYYTRSGSVLAATHDTGASVDRLTRDYGGKRETVAQWLAVPLASTGAPAHVAYPHANGTLYDCAGCESVCYCATLDALTDASVRNDYDVSMCVRCAVLAETLADTNAVDGPVVRFVHWWNVRGRVALLDDVRSEAREGSGWGETVERVASVRWINTVTATTLDDYDTVGEAISAGTVEIGDDGRAYAARATDYARLAIGASTDPAPVSAAPDVPAMSYNSRGAQLLRSVTATQPTVWTPADGWTDPATPGEGEPDDDTDPDDDGEPVSRCVVCGEVIDYCNGHGPIGDPDGARVLDDHDNDEHSGCHPAGCEVMRDALRAACALARCTGSREVTHVEDYRDRVTGELVTRVRATWRTGDPDPDTYGA